MLARDVFLKQLKELSLPVLFVLIEVSHVDETVALVEDSLLAFYDLSFHLLDPSNVKRAVGSQNDSTKNLVYLNNEGKPSWLDNQKAVLQSVLFEYREYRPELS